MTTKRSMIKVLLLPAVVLGMLGAPSAAMADTGANTAQQELGFYMTGFDEAVANANGYKIVTYANGDRQSVPIDPNSALPKSPIVSASDGARTAPLPTMGSPTQFAAPANTDYNEVWGNCGRSWIRVAQTGTNKVSIVSGFSNTPYTAISWSWDVQLNDINGTSHQRYPGSAIFDDKATRVWQNLNQYGYTFDFVYAGVAILINGLVCTSGHPDVSIYL